MIKAAMIGLGWWGKTLVESVQGTSDIIQFVAASSRSQADDHKQFAAAQKLTLHRTYEEALADPQKGLLLLAVDRRAGREAGVHVDAVAVAGGARQA